MDAIDRQLLSKLQSEGRATQLELSKEIGLSQPATAERIKKLEERGVIKGYAAMVDPQRVGKDVTAFIGVSIEHPKYFEGFSKRVLSLPDVLECHRVAGNDSYLLKVRTTNTGALDELLVDRLRTIAGVTRTHTTIVLSSVKETTQLSLPEEEISK